MDSDLDSLLNSITGKPKDKTKLIIPEEKVKIGLAQTL